MVLQRVLLSIRSVSKVYRMGEVDVHALRNASLDIYDGEFLIIIGPSGSGKSTLLNQIGGMDRPTSGTISFMDRELSKSSDYELTLYRRREVGFIFQFYNLIPTLTALENVQVATEIVENPMTAMEALQRVGLAGRADHFPSQLSGGEQQRISVARALASNPRLLLCDEPTGALDVETSRQVLGMLSKLNRELQKTVVLITHNNAIAGLGDRVARIRDGTIHHIRTNDPPKSVEEIHW
ncbi:MAG: ABC transporter ATP-binding protein [Candidatus Omnitrophota bacterium]|jgi:putative ABC transport system ATP-binding protein|nr:MAG: ABC transporter ATP-binding protein [Candidatus Omnitrophota bacterium]